MRPTQIRNLILWSALIVFLLWAVSTLSDFIIEYNWWKELGQVNTWIGMLWYSIAPAAAGSLVALVALWVAHARGLQFAGIRRQDFRLYSRLIPVGLAFVAIVFAAGTIDYWTVMRYFGSRGISLPAGAWKAEQREPAARCSKGHYVRGSGRRNRIENVVGHCELRNFFPKRVVRRFQIFPLGSLT